ncbi:hypothetical protein GCM10025867_25380 [Frondihabitans sucicola]|uniref:DUF418 domain-containing protein n=1 Tax=Frondihabitans sucicola TaxID=1268041 RepID=A0ABM8GPV5_9MICO|nr:hypothetical protein [Frondihabitans sucicola]BDZ50297.1 hypothetical protein GCM10025867_25380 [Frondihabitans sucicola]
MEAVSYSVSMVLFVVIVAETGVSVRARRAVRGSRERYVAMTQRRILSWTVNIGFAVQGVFGLMQGQSFAFVSLLFAIYLSYMELKNHKDDDDWFNGRMKKIWKGVRRHLAAVSRPKAPVRIPAPSPVFG